MENNKESKKADVNFMADIIHHIRLFQVNDVSIEKTAENILLKAKEWEAYRKTKD